MRLAILFVLLVLVLLLGITVPFFEVFEVFGAAKHGFDRGQDKGGLEDHTNPSDTPHSRQLQGSIDMIDQTHRLVPSTYSTPSTPSSSSTSSTPLTPSHPSIVLDMVVIAHTRDLRVLRDLGGLHSMVRYISPKLRRVIIVAPGNFMEDPRTRQMMRLLRAEHFDEANFPFNMSSFRPKTAPFVYQQFLKLYVFHVIPGLAFNCLIMDSDVVFVRDHTVLFPQVPQASLALKETDEFVPPRFLQIVSQLSAGASHTDTFHYRRFVQELMPGMNLDKPKHLINGTAVFHHAIFQRDILWSLHRDVRKHRNKDQFFKVLEDDDLRGIPFSEYQLYHAYVNRFFPERMVEENTPVLGAYHNCSHHMQDQAITHTDVVFMACHSKFIDKKGGYGMICSNSKTGCIAETGEICQSTSIDCDKQVRLYFEH